MMKTCLCIDLGGKGVQREKLPRNLYDDSVINIRLRLLRTLQMPVTGTVDVAFLLLTSSLQRGGGRALFVNEETGSERRSGCRGHPAHQLVELSRLIVPLANASPGSRGRVVEGQFCLASEPEAPTGGCIS